MSKKKPAWQNDGDDLNQRIARMHAQDEAFQAALRKAGVPEFVNKSYHNSVARRFQSERPDVLKTTFD